MTHGQCCSAGMHMMRFDKKSDDYCNFIVPFIALVKYIPNIKRQKAKGQMKPKAD